MGGGGFTKVDSWFENFDQSNPKFLGWVGL